MKYFSFLLLTMTISVCANAKIWRINNNPGVVADFTSLDAAVNAAAAGDTIYVEPSATSYGTGSFNLNKRVVVIGPGYFLDPANAAEPANTGLQVATKDSRIEFFRIGTGSDGSKFLGITIAGSVYITGAANIAFEKVYFPSGAYFENGTSDNVSFRKCFFNNGVSINTSTTSVITNIAIENNIFYNNAYVSLNTLTGSGNIFRNNSVVNNGNTFILVNTYIANNIFGSSQPANFINCTIKNNLFDIAQTLPGTAINNLVNIDMSSVYVNGTTGSLDSRCALKAGSPAIAAGLTVGSVVTPNCGAFGATDPYKLSGIPNVPSIYALTVPTSIPSGSATMNINFSTRNNN